jgi:hypothetical protein
MVLGLRWNTETDEISMEVKINYEEKERGRCGRQHRP